MKNLGEVDEGGASVSNGRQSKGKFDPDWTAKVEIKLRKLSSTVKVLTNKLTDMRNVSAGNSRTPIRRSQSILSPGGGSNSSLRKNKQGGMGTSTPDTSEYNGGGGSRRAGTAGDSNYNEKARRHKILSN